MQFDLFAQHQFKFFSLGSGSSGNCYYLGTREYGILIDAGIGIRTVRKTLKDYGIAFEKILGVIVTHNHADHIKTVGTLGVKHEIPVYATQTVHDNIKKNRYIDVTLRETKRVIEKEVPFDIRSFRITAFEVPHDSSDNVGYHIELGGQIFVFITDAGQITPTMQRYAATANHLVIESNYDEDMLLNGKYPSFLKERIANGTGHLSNCITAKLIAEIYNSTMKNIWLCHLSQDNNKPELAYKATEDALISRGAIVGETVKLEALARYKASGLREF